MVFDKNFTIVVSSPFAQNQRGFVYVFNGTLRHWSQMQKLAPADIGGGGFFGSTNIHTMLAVYLHIMCMYAIIL
jgi:hypothetical protein